MPKDTPSMVRNKIRRSLRAILDPYPSPQDMQNIWGHFECCCAYCGVAIQRASRNGHMDHVVPSALGGNNCVNNYVLACARCNGDEKRQANWTAFLRKKAESPAIEAARRDRIEKWLSGGALRIVDTKRAAEIETIIAEAITHYDSAVAKIRTMR